MTRPYTVGNLAISIDGRISTVDRLLHGFGGPQDRDLMEQLRAAADAIMVGAGTLRDEEASLQVKLPQWQQRRLELGLAPQPAAVVVSRGLDFPWRTLPLFRRAPHRRIVITRPGHSPGLLEELGQVAEVVVVPLRQAAQGPAGGSLDLPLAMQLLHERGISQLLLEGGGELNFSMLAAGLIDEMYLTLCPLVFGGQAAPGAFSGPGFPAGQQANWRLRDFQRGENDRLYLRYEATNSIPHPPGIGSRFREASISPAAMPSK
ncbi:MAG: RibD family protein [Planctomycetaceae bacterium]